MQLSPAFEKKRLIAEALSVPPDKSIAQRAVLLAAIAQGRSCLRNFPFAGDPLSTLRAMQTLGISISERADQKELVLSSNGPSSIQEAAQVIDLGNSGTGYRLLLGLLAGLPGERYHTLVGDQSLSQRPMRRVTEPLQQLGAQIYGRGGASYPPLSVIGKSLEGGQLQTTIASAQLKSALLLAGLHAKAPLTVQEPLPSRDHTEIMLQQFGADLQRSSSIAVRLQPSILQARDLNIPGDVSGAAFLVVAACLLPRSSLCMTGVGLNPTRTAFLRCLQEMGARVSAQVYSAVPHGEPVGEIHAEYSSLHGTTIKGPIIPQVIDELPILALAAAQAEGVTEIADAQELRVKESDRLTSLRELLEALGVRVEERPDGLLIEGRGSRPFAPRETALRAGHDHRMAMTAAVASLLSERALTVEGSEWAAISFPGFQECLAAHLV